MRALGAVLVVIGLWLVGKALFVDLYKPRSDEVFRNLIIHLDWQVDLGLTLMLIGVLLLCTWRVVRAIERSTANPRLDSASDV